MSDLVFPDAGGDIATRIDQLRNFTEMWLANRRLSEHTRTAYRVDIRQWLAWCRANDLDPLLVKFTHVNAWGRDLEDPDRCGYSSTTAARKLSAVSSWYTYLAKLDAIAANPAAIADRPVVDRDFTSTVAFDRAAAQKMLTAAADGSDELGPVAPVLAQWLVELGTRVSETCDLNLGDVTHDRGHRVVQMRVKGGKRISRTIPGRLATALDAYLESRGLAKPDEEQKKLPLLASTGGHRIGRHAVARFVKRIARRAGLDNADRISPHSFRHAWNTMAREAGGDIEDRQRALGHRDPRTTMRYDRTDRGADRDPSLLIERAFDPQPDEGE